MSRRVWDRPIRRVTQGRQQIDPLLRDVIFRRQYGQCACCGQPLGNGWQAHHRKLRSQGGQDSICNLIGLRGSCHRSVHDHPARSMDHGYIVRSTDDPAAIALHLYDGRMVLLATDGSFLPVKGAA